MKIGVVTYWSSDDNYGQQLQCFALQRCLISLGHDAFLIKYQPEEERKSLLQRIVLKFSIKKIFNVLNGNRKKNKEFYDHEEKLKKQNEIFNKKREFEEFRKKNICSTDIIYRSIDQLRLQPPPADVYICGSDQVWNNSVLQKNSAGWFLDFGSAKRVAYAASIGRSIEKRELPKFIAYLKKFDAIGVREKGVESFCRSIGFENTKQVLDPTLLLRKDDYQQLFESSHKDFNLPKYTFVYALNILTPNEIEWDVLQDYLKANNLNVRFVSSSGYYQARKLIDSVNPELLSIQDWILGIANSTNVVTTSFHGVVFSIIMHKNFIAIPLRNAYATGNMRIECLLKSLGLENRIYTSEQTFNQVMDCEIDWQLVDSRLDVLRKNSLAFLLNAIG